MVAAFTAERWPPSLRFDWPLSPEYAFWGKKFFFKLIQVATKAHWCRRDLDINRNIHSFVFDQKIV